MFTMVNAKMVKLSYSKLFVVNTMEKLRIKNIAASSNRRVQTLFAFHRKKKLNLPKLKLAAATGRFMLSQS